MKLVSDFSKKEQQIFLRHLINSLLQVCVIEKGISTHLRIQWCSEENRWSLYKPGDFKVTFIDKTLMRFYQEIDKKIATIDFDNISKNLIFGLSYHHEQNTIRLIYMLRRENGKIEEIFDFDELKKYATRFQILEPKIYFQNKLTSEQIEKIQRFFHHLNWSKDDQTQEFGTSSFVEYLLQVLRIPTENYDLGKIIFKFPEEKYTIKANQIEAKFSSYDEKENTPNDFYWILLFDFLFFIKEKNLDEIELQGSTGDQRYVFLISELFAEFLTVFEEKYEDVDFEMPNFLKTQSFRLNYNFIQNKNALKFILKNKVNENIFKILLNAFRKERKRGNSIFTKSLIKVFNVVVNKIEGKVQKSLVKNVNEKQIFTYSEIVTNNPEKIYWISNFDTFTNEHVEAAYNLHQEKNRKVVLVILGEENKYEKQKVLLEVTKEYVYIDDVIIEDQLLKNQKVYASNEIEEKFNLKIDENYVPNTFLEFKSRTPKPIHKFFERMKKINNK